MRTLGALLLTLHFASVALGDASYRFRLTSLFQPDRVADFHALLKEHHPGITAESVDFDTSLVTLRIDSAANPSLEKARNPEQVRTQLNAMLRNSSKGVFELLALSEMPAEELVQANIPVIGLDCKGCAFGAYRTVAKLDGVQYVTVSFKDGLIRTRFDRRKTSLETIEAALGQARIMIHHRIDHPRAVPTGEMRIVRVSSEETNRDEIYAHSTGLAANVIDGDPLTKWSTKYAGVDPTPPPHELVIDLSYPRKISAFQYLPRQIGYVGHFAKTEFRVSDDPDHFPEEPSAKATFTASKKVQSAECSRPVNGRFVLVRILSEISGKPIAAAAEIAVIQAE
jgi:copper chaperone CopZ